MRTQLVMKLFLALTLLVTGHFHAQPAPAPRTTLRAIKQDVHFESTHTEELTQQAKQLANTIAILTRGVASDEAILKAFAQRDALVAQLQKSASAQERLAILAENLNTAMAAKLSEPEHQAYRQCQLTLTEISKRLTNIVKYLKLHQGRLHNYLQQIKPPASIALACGLTLKLQTTPNGAFYLSQPVPVTLAVAHGLRPAAFTQPYACLNHFQAKQLALALQKSEQLPLSLPTHAQVENIPPSDWRDFPAVWCHDIFSMKASLALTRRRPTRTTNDDTITKLKLTPAQNRAIARFKMTFMLVWDPAGRLGSETLTRELPQTVMPEIATCLTMPGSAGKNRRLAQLDALYQTQLNHQRNHEEKP